LAILKIQVHRDRSKELADNRRFTLAANIEVYFCDPQTTWQRGSKFEEGPSGAKQTLREAIPQRSVRAR
jgi:IS30 family transposase